MQVPLYGSKYAVNTIRRLFHTFSQLYVTHIVQMVVHGFPLDCAAVLQAGLEITVQKVYILHGSRLQAVECICV